MLKTLNKTLFLIFALLSLTGCSTIAYIGHTTERHYSEAQNLPADYPTKYLPDGNIWDEIGRNLKFADNIDLPYVRDQIRWFQKHQDFLNRTIERGAPFIYYIYQETKRRHLPAELVLVPIFESGYSACSRSYASAVGFWQFMPKTAKGFHLKINRWYDGRCDPVASTNIALTYFTQLHAFFDNDWFSAIAAYNAGPGRIQKAILKNQRLGKSTNFWDLDVKDQTLVYVPKLLALAAIIRTPERYGVKLLSVNDGPYFEQVEITSQIDLRRAAKLAEVDLDTIKRLNPAFKRGVTDPDGPHVLLIPKSKVAIFKANAEGTPRPITKEITPAAKTVSTESTATDETIIDKSTSVAKSRKTGVTTKPTINVQKPIAAVNTIPYKTANGDSIFRIAQRFHTTPGKIKAVNNLKGNSIKIGQVLQIPTTTKTTTSTIKKNGTRSVKKAKVTATPKTKVTAHRTVRPKTTVKKPAKQNTRRVKKN